VSLKIKVYSDYILAAPTVTAVLVFLAAAAETRGVGGEIFCGAFRSSLQRGPRRSVGASRLEVGRLFRGEERLLEQGYWSE
jgi:hypothetical protein